MNKCIAVIGGSCIDIFAASASPIIPHDSNPGTVQMGFGGVGRNIAENLARLEQDVYLIAPFGNDPISGQMLTYTTQAGVNTALCLISSESTAPYYISINDSNGNMAMAVNDMAICEQITPQVLEEQLAFFNHCEAVIFDTNIPGNTIQYLADNCRTPLYADAVSTKKAMKLLPVLPHLYTLNTNIHEAQALLNIQIIADASSLRIAANRFHTIGIKHVFITLGAEGAFYSCPDKQLMMKALPNKPKNTNGCGDAFSAAAFYGIMMNDLPERLLSNALQAAAITAESEFSVSPQISLKAIETRN